MPDFANDLGPDLGPDIRPSPVAAGASATHPAAILVAVVFTFAAPVSAPAVEAGEAPDFGPDIGPDVSERSLPAAADTVAVNADQSVNAGQSVSVQMLDAGGASIQDYVPGLTVDLSGGQYGASFSVPPGFTGFARAALTSGPNAGQVNSQAINLSTASDLSDVAWTLGPPQTSLLDAASNEVLAGSSGFLHVLVSGVSNASGAPISLAGNPVALAVTPGTPTAGDFPQGDYQLADWMTVSLPGADADTQASPASQTYARLGFSAEQGNLLAAGNYRVYLRINGTLFLRCPGFFSVQS